ncbi:LysR family transcriptional regulator [Pigmentiphaga aceris]|uniref:LysR family transcriptional regulator n=1 Tax=Pigmentiphaga aceris TaxID=1940612 RepID=A0A5C0AW54_9BURK|nr:LysR family transcriptional regulator [Pigmentiphaga aceris]QEI06538.1 LysR family transcriptional regulator [Pigmentiphaga aceris]
MDRLQAMKVFVKVAETQGFAESARQLLMSPPGVTRAIAALEAGIGARLFTRTTRSVKLTEAGERYYEDCRRILGEIEEAEAAAGGSYATPAGTLTVTAPVHFGQLHVLPVLIDYLDQHPAVTVRTMFVDRLVNLVDEGIEVAIRIGHLPDSGLHAVAVGEVHRVLCASPNYLANADPLTEPADLAAHRIVASTGAWSSTEWRFGLESKTTINVKPRLLCNTNDAAIAAAVSGWGITRVLSYQVRQHVNEGRLQILLPQYQEAAMPVHIVYSAGRKASAKVRAFVDLAAARLRVALAA